MPKDESLMDMNMPSGLRGGVHEGWWLLRQVQTPVPPVRIGGMLIPPSFEFVVSPVNDGWHARLMFLASEETKEVSLVNVFAAGDDVDVVLDKLRKARPISWWKRKALWSLTVELTERELAETRGVHYDFMNDEQKASDQEGMRLIWDRLNGVDRVPVTRRRDRVTNGTLLEVATVYREAWTNGANPTQAVAKHFHKSHSTAARYVGMARKAGHLGEADGSKGGEVISPAAATQSTTKAKEDD